ncbi:MAG: TetR/AcrR family transcriptional regulator [Oscillospiraceae bacterium]|nr:TetR/AcrR family transcriptional regulator [Oscillospiraceae bacterium]
MGLARNYNKHIKDDVSTIDFSADLTDEENLSPKHRRILYLLDRCFDCICDLGLEHAGTGALAKYCGTSSANLFNNYFNDKDEIIVHCCARCMQKVEDDFMSRAPQNPSEIENYIMTMPYITAELHGKKYRAMYQIYSSPKYLDEGKKFFDGVTKRYTEYANQLAPKLGLPADAVQGLIFIFVRACVHYAMFENEEYLKSQQKILISMVHAMMAHALQPSK